MTTALLIVLLVVACGVWLAVADIRNDVRHLRRAIDAQLPQKARW